MSFSPLNLLPNPSDSLASVKPRGGCKKLLSYHTLFQVFLQVRLQKKACLLTGFLTQQMRAISALWAPLSVYLTAKRQSLSFRSTAPES